MHIQELFLHTLNTLLIFTIASSSNQVILMVLCKLEVISGHLLAPHLSRIDPFVSFQGQWTYTLRLYLNSHLPQYWASAYVTHSLITSTSDRTLSHIKASFLWPILSIFLLFLLTFGKLLQGKHTHTHSLIFPLSLNKESLSSLMPSIQIVLVVVQLPSHVRLFATPWTAACPASLSQSFSQSLPKFMSIASVMPSNHLILWCSLLLPSIFPNIRDFSNELTVCIRWPKYWSFSFSISPSSEYSGLISLKIDWFDFLAVWGLSGVFSSTTVWRHQFFGLCLLYSPALTTVRDHWEDHSLDYMDLCQQSNVSAFQHTVLGLS